MARKAGKLTGFGAFKESFRDAFGEGREEWSRSFREGRKGLGKAEQSTRWDEMTGSYPTGVRIKELVDDATGRKLNEEEKIKRDARASLGLQPKEGFAARTGQMLGTVAADLTQDSTRNFIWLLNAAQASGNVIAENVIKTANDIGRTRFKTGTPDLYGKSRVEAERGGVRAVTPMQKRSAFEKGYLNKEGGPLKGYSIDRRWLHRKT